MNNFYFSILEFIALFIGSIGILVIFIGSILAFYKFLKRDDFTDIRLGLVRYILLGLDFLIAKDIIETVILPDDKVWTEVAVLFLIVIIRVTFSYFTNKELQEIMERKSHSKK